MRIRTFVFAAAFAALALGTAPSAPADDAKPTGQVIVFGDGVARFYATQDRTAGYVTFRVADPAVRVTSAPVVVVQTDSGPREVTLVAVDGQPGTWRLAHEVARSERFDGTMKIVIDNKTYTSPIVLSAGPATGTVVRVAPRHGGRVLAFNECGANVEVVQDPATGTLTIYSFEDVQVLEAPVITVTQTEGPATTTVTKVEGQPGVWRVTNSAFKTTSVTGKIRIMVNGKPCEAPLTFAAGTHGGEIVTSDGGLRFEVVRDDKSRYYTFYALDETYNGKPYTVENPQVVVTTREGPRTVVLTPVEKEPRAWRLVGLEGGVSEPLDGRLKFTLFGKSLETKLGLSGFAIDAK